jgi:hypothetical protein
MRFFANNESNSARRVSRIVLQGVEAPTFMISKYKAGVTLAFVAFGYVGAAINYSHLVGCNVDFPYLCPVCPEILSLGSPLSKFIWRTITMGTFNAVLFIAVGWALVGIALSLKRFFPTQPSA